MTMEVLERFLLSKTGDRSGGEDRVVITHDFAAVIDGATAKYGVKPGMASPGALAADAIADALSGLPAQCNGEAAIAKLDQAVSDIGAGGPEAPSAVCAVYSSARRQLWIAGDVGARVNDQIWPATKAVDDIASAVRAAIIRADLLNGAPMETLRQSDPGREAILPLLKRQAAFANLNDGDPLSFCTLDGRGQAAELIKIIDVPVGATVVICTDGYLSPAPTLRQAEDELAASLASDPLRVLEHPTTKAVMENAVSFDDRAYVRFRT